MKTVNFLQTEHTVCILQMLNAGRALAGNVGKGWSSMAKRISTKECEALFLQCATPPHVVGHCREVSRVAAGIGEAMNRCGYRLDIDLIRGAGLCHDVLRVCDKHAEAGAELLENLGYQAEADIIRVHMTYDFHDFSHLDETDLVCLADRLVMENHYVGLDKRIDYILQKAKDHPGSRRRILQKKEETRLLMSRIEEVIGQSVDSLFADGQAQELPVSQNDMPV